MRGSSLPIVLSRRIIPFPYDEAENTYTLEPDFEIQLADFGTGEQGPDDQTTSCTYTSHLVLFSG